MLNLYIGIVLVLVLLFFTNAQRNQSECEFTASAYPCSEPVSSGSCVRPQSNGLCLIGECSPSYQCDCLGYEICRRTNCSLYKNVENTIQIESIPFPCHLAHDEICTTFDFIQDTLESTDKSLSAAIFIAEEMATEFTKSFPVKSVLFRAMPSL